MAGISLRSIFLSSLVGLGLSPGIGWSQALHELAYSERLSLKYYALIDKGRKQWCASEVKVQVQVPSNTFTPNADFLSLTQRVGGLVGQECQQATLASISVIDPSMGGSAKPLWIGASRRADGWKPIASESGCSARDLDCENQATRQTQPQASSSAKAALPVASTYRPDRNFAGQDLSRQDLNTSALDGSNFAGATLKFTNLTNSRLRNSNFQDADLRGAMFGGSDLSGSDLRGAALPFSDVGGVTMQNVNMEGLDLKGQGFFWVDLTGANLRNTKNFGTVESTNFTNADLRGANLLTAWTNSGSATLSAAKFKGALYDEDTVFPKGFSPKIAGMVFSEPLPNSPPSQPSSSTQTSPSGDASPQAKINSPASDPKPASSSRPGKSFAGKTLPEGSDFQNENLRNANFEGADLNGAKFLGALLENANFRNADLRSTSFRRANLSGADFTGAKLDLSKNPTWVGAQLTGAKLPNLEFKMVGCANYHSAAFFDLASPRVLAMIADRNNAGTSFRNAVLTNSIICGDMTGVDFRGADLRGADFTSATEMSNALLGGAQYDSQTKLPIDPAQFRMVKGPDLVPVSNISAPGAGQGIVGEWWIDKERPGHKDTPYLGFLGLDAKGQFEWSPGDEDAKLIYGQWQQTPKGVLLKSGEGGKDWMIVMAVDQASGEALLTIQSVDGTEVRTAFRKVDEKK